MQKLNVHLLTGRTIDQGKGKELGKMTKDYQKSVALCEMDPKDMCLLQIKDGSDRVSRVALL